jgi:hypothetical protein
MGGMMSLASFQNEFARALMAEPSPTLGLEIAALARQPGFAVYRNTVMKGCIDALQANYPAVCRLVGEEWFRAAAAVYVPEHLPREPMLLRYGEDFAEFLASFPPAAELPYLAGVARLDRFWTEAHVARDEQPVEGSDVASLAPRELALTRLRPIASARWACFDDQPIFTLWKRNREGYADLSDLDWHGEAALLVRPQDSVEWFEIDAAGCAFLDACAAGETVEQAAAAALAVDAKTDLSRLMASLLQAHALTANPSNKEKNA